MAVRNFDKRRYRSKLPMYCGRPDLTPLIDVLFLSLIFFCVSSSFVKLYGVKVELPQTEQASSTSVQKQVISITHNEYGDRIYFNDAEVTKGNLGEELRGRAGMVIICADRNTSVDTLAQVMVIVEKAKLSAFLAVSDDMEQKEILFEN